jgi:hypothetical protein
MPLFTYPPVPNIVYIQGTENASNNASVTAGAAFFQLVVVYAPVTIAQIRCYFSGSPTGNVDMGIYDSTGTNGKPNNLLAHTGAIASATGMFTQSLTASYTLTPGNYWLAFLDTVGDSVSSRQPAASGMGPLYRTTATNLTVLGSTAGTIQDINFQVAMFALVSGGYS